MALNQEELQKLRAVKFDSFYQKDKGYWDGLTKQAYDYTLKILPEGAKIRPDDVATFLTPTIRQNPKFISYCQSKKSVQQYWCKWYSDLIIDTYFLENKELK
jgi:hypothetical protein